MNQWALIFKRLKSESPLFFRKVINAGLWMTGAAIAGRSALALIPDEMPHFFTTVFDYMAVCGATLSFGAKLTTTNNDLQATVTPKDAAKIEDGKITKPIN